MNSDVARMKFMFLERRFQLPGSLCPFSHIRILSLVFIYDFDLSYMVIYLGHHPTLYIGYFPDDIIGEFNTAS